MTLSLDLTGRRLMIVGASSGIGRAAALEAGKAGARLALVGRRAGALAEVIAQAGDAVAISADVTDEAESARAVDEAVAHLGALDAVLFPLGITELSMMAQTGHDVWLASMLTNVIAPAQITRAALPHLAQGGLFLYVSSENVAKPVHGLGAYGASKAALDHSIRTWRLEHPEHRFMRLVVGATRPTDISRNFPFEVISECMRLWLPAGLVPAQNMHTDDVGLALVELASLALAHPGIALNDTEFLPPGASLDPKVLEQMLATGDVGNSAEFAGE